jgi:hypothetical protein
MTDRRTPPRKKRRTAGQKLAYVYFEDESGRRSAAKLLTKMKREGLRPTLRSCRSYCGSITDPAFSHCR